MKLLVLDVEGTLFEAKIKLPGTSLNSTIWQAIAHELGAEASQEELETHKNWEAGKYPSYLDWMKDTIRIHRKYGLSVTVFESLIASAKYNPGVIETLARLDRSRYEIVLISGGFRELARRVQRDCDIYHAFAACEYFFNSQGTLASWNLLPCDFKGKIDFINLMLREYNLSPQDWIFMGDGQNDIPIAGAAPMSVAYRGHKELRQASIRSIDDFEDILTILSSQQT